MLVEGIPVFDKSNICELKNNLELYPNGIIVLIDKPYKWTSADAVRKVKFLSQRFFHKKLVKIGHAGTLDPLATGLLILCIGNATKKAELLQCGDKEYIAEIEFGATTPSLIGGEVKCTSTSPAFSGPASQGLSPRMSVSPSHWSPHVAIPS